jgi:hypothetical protein
MKKDKLDIQFINNGTDEQMVITTIIKVYLIKSTTTKSKNNRKYMDTKNP